ncbi:MAG: hypothetical protein K2K34_10420, partial [Oscillospiraceae bacterium]|nr:hypothetical protein [Oscillospiraceae bacterium]
FFDISAADKELLKIITDETGLPEEVLLEYARKIDYCRALFHGGIYDFNGDGVPDFYNSAMDMATSSLWTYDISGRKPEFMWRITAGMKPRDTDEWIKLYYDRKEKKYFYHTATAYILKGESGFIYRLDCSQINVDFENHSFSDLMQSFDAYSTEDEWKAAYAKTEKDLSRYSEEIDTLYTLGTPHFYEEEGSYSLRLLHSYYRSNSRRKLAMLLNETGVSGLTFNMSTDEVKELLGEPKEFIDETEDFDAVTLKYDSGSLTFVDLEKDGNYQLAFMRLYSFDFCGITENTSRSELISALKNMGIYPEPNFDLFPEIKTLENTDQITAGDYNGLGISFDMDGDRIEYLTASFVALT